MAERMKYFICAHAKKGGRPQQGVNDWPVKASCPNLAKTKHNTLSQVQTCESCEKFKKKKEI